MFLKLLSLLCVISSTLSEETFTNPIFDGNSADPFVIHLQNHYYMILSTDYEHSLTIYKSDQLTNFRNAESSVIYRAPPGYQNVWASEMHEIDGELYIYFAMGLEGDFNRNWVIKALDPTNPMGNYTSATRVNPTLEQPGVDGTILRHNGKIYYVWSGRDGIEGSIRHDSILISEMISPLVAKPEFSVIRQPTYGWERNVNEGPFFIYNRNVSYLLFAASFTFSEYYCLGLMSIDEGKDPMVPSNWWFGPEEGPVFEKNDVDVFGSGHASFTTSPDGQETWMVYHASEDRNIFEHYRIARAEKVTWDDETGRPVFPVPHGYYDPIPVPSGQLNTVTKTTFTNPILSGDAPDPRVTKINSTYYLTLSSKSQKSIKIIRSSKLTNFRNSPTAVLLENSCYSEIWSPELRELQNNLYLYFSGLPCNGGVHTIFVMKAEDPQNPFGKWSEPKKLLDDVNSMTADGTVISVQDKLYLIYESHEAPYGLHAVQMVDPMSVNLESRKPVITPTESWHNGVVNGPGHVVNNGNTFLSYSGGDPGSQDYCIGMKMLRAGQDPLNPNSWEDVNNNSPVFCKNSNEGVYGPGHASFVSSPDNSETWMVYHAAEYPDRIFGNRVPRIEKITWGGNGKPVFPSPHGYGSPQALPAGEV